MKKIVRLSLAAAMLSGLGAVSAQASEDGVSILSDIKLSGQIRPRVETVDDGNTATKDAATLTARTKLTVEANLFEIDGLKATIGMISVNNFGFTDYYDGGNGHSSASVNSPDAYAKIVDPQDAMFSEASIDYTVGNTALHIGRSNINLDNQRFIGTVGWRQLERSYDTVYVANSDVENLNLLAAYVYGYAGVGGVATTNTNSLLLNASYAVMPELKVTGYGYLLSSIHDTYGVALTGKVDVGAKISYRAEYAIQNDPSLDTDDTQTNVNADASYINLDVGANVSGFLVGLNYELQSGADSVGETAFTTPLGTNHGFNGWADQFLSTPTVGLTDLNVRAGYKAKGFGKLLVKYHMFTSDVDAAKVGGGTTDDLGSEINVVYVNKIPGVKGLNGLVKYASFSAGESTLKTNDVEKVWVGVDYKF